MIVNLNTTVSAVCWFVGCSGTRLLTWRTDKRPLDVTPHGHNVPERMPPRIGQKPFKAEKKRKGRIARTPLNGWV